MRLSDNAFRELDSHWALQAIGSKSLERAIDIANERLVKQAAGRRIPLNFQPTDGNDNIQNGNSDTRNGDENTQNNDDDTQLLERVALAYELAAIEGLGELYRLEGGNDSLRQQAIAASFRVFDIRSLLPVPGTTHERLHHVFQLSALAYCGDRWSDLRHWYSENPEALAVPSVVDVSWDKRLFYRLFHCWTRLFKKSDSYDLDRIRETIASLRDDQKTMEGPRLHNESPEVDRAIALRLVALYHWARATEILAVYMLQGQPTQPFGHTGKHYEAAIQAATASGDAQHEMTLRWLYATSQSMITDSLLWVTNRRTKIPINHRI